MRDFEKHALLFLLRHLLAGIAAAVIVGTGLIGLDVDHLGTLIRHSDHAVLVTVMLFSGLIITFGSVAMGAGIMSLARYDDER
ncbi:MAG: hypothetical protein P4M00_14920 [Azospirillaceae bacterium]|nr:hypothetical protein [Azospirillaceae bacterium]